MARTRFDRKTHGATMTVAWRTGSGASEVTKHMTQASGVVTGSSWWVVDGRRASRSRSRLSLTGWYCRRGVFPPGASPGLPSDGARRRSGRCARFPHDAVALFPECEHEKRKT